MQFFSQLVHACMQFPFSGDVQLQLYESLLDYPDEYSTYKSNDLHASHKSRIVLQVTTAKIHRVTGP
jgi:hypothetical protein